MEIELYRHKFPASRICDLCRAAESAETEQRRAEILFRQAHIPSAYSGCRFSNFERIEGTADAYNISTHWSTEYRHGRKPRRGILFHGPPGSGKTHLCVALLHEAVFSRFSRCLFLNVPEWLNHLRELSQGGEGIDLPSPRGFDVVVIDDIGAENSSGWARDQIYNLLNHREANRLSTFATSNLTPGELTSRLGSPVMSRLVSLCQAVELNPRSDYRERLAS